MEEVLQAFYAQRGTEKPLNAVEYIGLRTLIEKSIEGTDYCPFSHVLALRPRHRL